MLSLPPDVLSAALFRSLARGEASASRLSSALFSELASHCPTCRATLQGFIGREQAQAEGGRVLCFPSAARASSGSFAGFAELAALAPEARMARVRRSRKRYVGNEAARRFLYQARLALPADAAASRQWAELAHTALQGGCVATPEEFQESADLDAKAWGFIANAERISGRLTEAEGILVRVSELIRATGVSDLSTIAELESFAASLFRAQRRWPEAHASLELAASLYAAVGDTEMQVRTELKAAINFYHAGAPQEMFDRLTALWPQATNSRLQWEIRHNQIFALLECGEATSAALLLDESLPLYEQFPDAWTQSRLAYVNGRILHALEIRGPAERNYRHARAGLLNLGEAYNAATISLDLAVLLLEDQRFAEVSELALDMLATFQKVGVHQEALAAWQLFVDAAHRQEASVLLARRLGRFLEHARQDPSLQFAAD